MKNKIHAIVQARLWSERLPNKTLLNLVNKETILSYLISSLKHSKLISKIIVATTKDTRDDNLFNYCLEKGYNVYRGSSKDVLSRYFEAALLYDSKVIVRITADDPFKDIRVIDKCISIILEDASLSYVSNTIEPTFPEGIDVEVFRFSSLEKANNEAKTKSDREHVTPYIWRNDRKFKLKCLYAQKDYSHYRLTVDYHSDYEVAKKIAANFSTLRPSYKQIIEYLDNNPSVRKINSGIIRNKGYLKSILEKKDE